MQCRIPGKLYEVNGARLYCYSEKLTPDFSRDSQVAESEFILNLYGNSIVMYLEDLILGDEDSDSPTVIWSLVLYKTRMGYINSDLLNDINL